MEEAKKFAMEQLRQRRNSGDDVEEDIPLTQVFPMAGESEGDDSEIEVDTRGDQENLIDEPELDENGFARDYEVALKHLGLGWFHVLLTAINGLALSSDAVEVLSISFILPVLKRPEEFAMEHWMSALLSSIIFIGMLFGSYFWGSTADILGRRFTLVCSLALSGIFGLASAFAPNYGIFIALRFCSGFGVGGSLPVIGPYVAEFIRNKYRGPVLGVQSMFWMVGRLLCGAFAWMIIPVGIIGPSFHSWRLFIAVSALPSLLGSLLYFFLPESPRFLLQVGKDKKALKALRLAYRINNLFKRDARFPVKGIILKDVESEGRMASSTRCQKLRAKIMVVLMRTRELFRRQLIRRTLLLLVIMFCLSFGSYGVSLWYPTYVDNLTSARDKEKFKEFCDQEVTGSEYYLQDFCGCEDTVFSNVNFSGEALKNWTIANATFINTAFTSLNMSETLFVNSTFINVTFSDVRMHTSYVIHSTWSEVTVISMVIQTSQLCGLELDNSFFTDTIYLQNVTFNNEQTVEDESVSVSQFAELLETPSNHSCNDRDLPQAICRTPDSFKLYRDSFFVSASALPGNIASAIAVYYLRRNYWLAFSLLTSTAAVFLLYFVHSEVFVVVMLCLFTALSTPAWNDSSLIMAEVYPTHLRATAFGVHLLVARIGAIIGTNIFGEFIYNNPSVPILLVALVLFVGGIAAIPLPKTTRKTQLT